MIMVTGANGQLGGDVCEILKKENEEFIGCDIDTLDLTDENAVNAFFDAHSFDAVIHCAAYTAVDNAQDNEDLCMKVNFDATKTIAQNCAKHDIKLIYISTDYVFDGSGETPFETEDTKGPLNVYGKSKLLGEEAVKKAMNKYFIVRTSWVYGEKNTNFIHTMLKLSKAHEQVSVVCDQIGSPTYSKHLAKLLCKMVKTEKYGTYHATNEGFCSWSQLAAETFKISGKSTKVIEVTTAQYKSKAKRPLNSRLSKKSLDDANFERLPKWQDAVKEYIFNINKQEEH